jgi:hypothetical protein
MQVEHEQGQYDRKDAIGECRHSQGAESLPLCGYRRFVTQRLIDGIVRRQVHARYPHGIAISTQNLTALNNFAESLSRVRYRLVR